MKLITLKIPEEMLKKWDNFIGMKGLKRSNFIRTCVNDHIKLEKEPVRETEEIIDKIVKLYFNSLEKRMLIKFQRLEALLRANLEKS